MGFGVSAVELRTQRLDLAHGGGQLRQGDHDLLGARPAQLSTLIETPPSKQQVWMDTMFFCHGEHGIPGLETLSHDGHFFIR